MSRRIYLAPEERIKLLASMAATIYAAKASSWKDISDHIPDKHEPEFTQFLEGVIAGETNVALHAANVILAAAEEHVRSHP